MPETLPLSMSHLECRKCGPSNPEIFLCQGESTQVNVEGVVEILAQSRVDGRPESGGGALRRDVRNQDGFAAHEARAVCRVSARG